MTRKVQCIALGKEADGLPFQPYPGELGQRIFENVSQQAWQKWLAHQTMLVNEMRRSPVNPAHRKFLEREMEKYFFGEGSEKPEGFVAPES